MQKSIAHKALQCLCPHINFIFFPAAAHLPTKAARCFPGETLPIINYLIKGELMSRHRRETALTQKPWFVSSDLHTHLYLLTRAHNAKGAAVIGRTISANWWILSASPSPHLLPPSVCEMHQISEQTQTILFIWTYPRTEPDRKGILTKPVNWGRFGGWLSPLTWYRTVCCMWKIITSC